MSLYFNLTGKCIHIYNIYNLVNLDKTSTSILILKRKLAAHPIEKLIILGDFNLHHEACGRPRASTTLIENSKKLLMVTQR